MLRSTDNRGPSDQVFAKIVFPGGREVVSTAGPWLKSNGDFKSILDGSAGRYRPGSVRLNPVTICEGDVSVTSGSSTCIYPSDGSLLKLDGPYIMPYVTSPQSFGVWNDSMADQSLSGANLKLRTADLEAGVMLAELKETLDMLRHPFDAFTKSLAKKTKSGKALLAPSLWLQYRYGWRPLLSDIEAIMKEFASEATTLSDRILSARANRTASFDNVTLSGAAYGGYLSFEVEKRTRTAIKSGSIIYYRVKQDRSFMEKMGMSLSDLPSIAWELVPYSFVVDWFLGIGDWIKNLNPTPTLDILGGCTSQKTTITMEYEPRSFACPAPSAKLVSATPSTYSWKSNTLIRRLGTAPPSLPVVKPALTDFNRVTDALSLCVQRIKFR